MVVGGAADNEELGARADVAEDIQPYRAKNTVSLSQSSEIRRRDSQSTKG